jgi:AraC family transcriptional regulator
MQMNAATSKVKNPRLLDGEPMRIAGFTETYTQQTMTGIPAQWRRFAPNIGKIAGQKSNVAYGVMLGASGGFEYMTGVEVSAKSSSGGDFKEISLPARKYAIFRHDGDVSTIWKTVDAIYQEWLPGSGHENADESKFIERYGEKFDPATASGDIEIWVPLKS